MLRDKTQNKIQLKTKLGQFGLTCQTWVIRPR